MNKKYITAAIAFIAAFTAFKTTAYAETAPQKIGGVDTESASEIEYNSEYESEAASTESINIESNEQPTVETFTTTTETKTSESETVTIATQEQSEILESEEISAEYSADSANSEISKGWQTENGRNVYYNENGEKVTGAVEIDGEKYPVRRRRQ